MSECPVCKHEMEHSRLRPVTCPICSTVLIPERVPLTKQYIACTLIIFSTILGIYARWFCHSPVLKEITDNVSFLLSLVGLIFLMAGVRGYRYQIVSRKME